MWLRFGRALSTGLSADPPSHHRGALIGEANALAGCDHMFKKSYEVVQALTDPRYQFWRSLNEREKRGKVVIGVIDDQPFDARENLENIGYNIRFLGDPQSIDVVEGCHLILCDLKDVGTALNPDKQGAFLIDEIKRNYPEKIVGAYTGGGMKPAISREALSRADFFMKKDAPPGDWRDKLDEWITKLMDPVYVWLRQRERLVEKDIDTFTILKLEDAFVKSVKNRESPNYSIFTQTINATGGDARAIVQNLVASGIYSLVTGQS